MAGGKASPRQKMINMMYLVLTALLAMNVSKEILEAFVKVEHSLETTINNFTDKNQTVYAQFDAAAKKNKEKAGPWKDKAYSIKAKANDAVKFIKDIKDEMLEATGGLNEEGIPVGMDKTEVPTNMLTVDPKRKDADGNFLGTQIKNKISGFREFSKSMLDPIQQKSLINSLEAGLYTKNPPAKEGANPTWETEHFIGLPFAAISTFLTKMQGDVRNAESDMITFFQSNIGKTDIKVNSLEPITMSRSNYILRGDSFQSRVFVAAFDTTAQPEVYIYDRVDENGNLLGDSTSLRVKNGKGFYSLKANSTGDFTWGGVVRVETPMGIKRYPFVSEYRVAEAAVVISPTKMNVLYRGVPNPISVSVPGVPSEDLIVTSDAGCSIKKVGNGTYEAMAGDGLNATIIVKIKDNQTGKIKTLGDMEFRCKRIPPPTAKIAGKIEGAISKNALAGTQGIGAFLEDFPFDIRYKVSKFTVRAQDGEFAKTIIVKGNKFNNEVKSLISSTKPGSDISFTGIEAVGPDGKKKCGAIVLTLQ
ncbi:MAG: gliding motility-associated protein GldM [Flavobacteriales bacterium]|jgi:gliding motility-associated protein GldM